MFAILFSFAGTFTACSSPDTGASCPSASAPTYAGFAAPFMAAYCTGCHSASARDRFGAPPGLDFDTEDEVRAHAHAIGDDAAAGPSGENDDMPDLGGPVTRLPSHAERVMLGEYLACANSMQ